MKTNFLIWKTRREDGLCSVTAPHGVVDDFDIDFGRPIASRWPSDVFCPMDPERPQDLELADCIDCMSTFARLVSARLAQCIHALDCPDIEYLPTRILNHKERLAADDYAFIHPVKLIDCLDLSASGAEFWDDSPEVFADCEQLVIDASRVPQAYSIFRPRYQPSLILMRADTAQRLRDGGFSGLHFMDPRLYQG